MGVALRGHLALSSTACYFTVADQRRIVLGEAKLSFVYLLLLSLSIPNSWLLHFLSASLRTCQVESLEGRDQLSEQEGGCIEGGMYIRARRMLWSG